MTNTKPGRPVAWPALKRIALRLPGVEESTSYGTPALKVRGKLMARLKEDGRTVVVRTTWEERERLLAVHPEVFSVTDHYRNHPMVLMDLSEAPKAVVERAIGFAWRVSAPKSLVAGKA